MTANSYCFIPRALPPTVEVITDGSLATEAIKINFDSFISVSPTK